MKKLIDLLTLEEMKNTPIEVDLNKYFNELTVNDLYGLFNVVRDENVKIDNYLTVTAYVLDILITRIRKRG